MKETSLGGLIALLAYEFQEIRGRLGHSTDFDPLMDRMKECLARAEKCKAGLVAQEAMDRAAMKRFMKAAEEA